MSEHLREAWRRVAEENIWWPEEEELKTVLTFTQTYPYEVQHGCDLKPLSFVYTDHPRLEASDARKMDFSEVIDTLLPCCRSTYARMMA